MHLLTALFLAMLCTVITYTTGNMLTYVRPLSCDCENVVHQLRQELETLQTDLQSQQEQTKQQLEDQQKLIQLRIEAQEKELHVLHKMVLTMVNGSKDEKYDQNSHIISKREVPSTEEPSRYQDDLLSQLPFFGLTGAPGRDGRDGKDGKYGEDGQSGENGRDGRDGIPGLPGVSCTRGQKGNEGATGPPGPPGLPGKDATTETTAGAVFTRWGRTTCGRQSRLVYAGFAANTRYGLTGGGTNYQCLPLDPEYNTFSGSVSNWGGTYMAGVEYQTYSYGVFPSAAHNQNVPCARCFTENRSAVMMIPAKRTCPDDWNKEYEGYLLTEREVHAHPSTFECVDSQPEYINGQTADTDGGLFYFIKTDCSGPHTTGHCPPYHGDRELTCVVCTK